MLYQVYQRAFSEYFLGCEKPQYSLATAENFYQYQDNIKLKTGNEKAYASVVISTFY